MPFNRLLRKQYPISLTIQQITFFLLQSNVLLLHDWFSHEPNYKENLQYAIMHCEENISEVKVARVLPETMK